MNYFSLHVCNKHFFEVHGGPKSTQWGFSKGCALRPFGLLLLNRVAPCPSDVMLNQGIFCEAHTKLTVKIPTSTEEANLWLLALTGTYKHQDWALRQLQPGTVQRFTSEFPLKILGKYEKETVTKNQLDPRHKLGWVRIHMLSHRQVSVDAIKND